MAGVSSEIKKEVSKIENPKLYPQLYAKKLVVIYKVTVVLLDFKLKIKYLKSNSKWEDQQQDASQETCQLH
jgi:hypothetical protein